MSILGRIKPTRTELMNLKKDEIFIHKARSLLEEKLTVLTIKVREIIYFANQAKKELNEKIMMGYRALALASMQMGLDSVDEIVDTARKKIEIRIRETSFMGVIIPEVNVTESKVKLPDHGIFRTSIFLDEAEKIFSDVLQLTLKLAGIENSGYRLIIELQKTRKRLNALEYILIPNYKKSILNLENLLEESERDDIVSMKISKDFLIKKRGGY
ncbi:MAG: V-type ATP synthase subunit D [Candidatus Helarchaeota archaeon]